MKAYTDLEQSIKLAKILPIESADMRYAPFGDKNPWVWSEDVKLLEKDAIPCWSLAALLEVLPKGEYEEINLCFGGYNGSEYIPEWFCSYEQQEPFIIEISKASNAIDACYELVLKLHELKKI